MLAFSARTMIENGTAAIGPAHSAVALDSLCSAGGGESSVPRVTIVCAHPDDEVIGAGARLAHLRDVHVVYVTDGAPRDMSDAIANGFTTREEYARVRAAERERALALADIAPARIEDIGLVDQEASFDLSELTLCLVSILERHQPEIVLTHAYEGGHPDHDATAFAVHHAVKLLTMHGGPMPTIAEFAGYHWRDGAMRTGCFLPHPDVSVRRLSLGKSERRLKSAMCACYESQQRVLASFAIDAESFRLGPSYDFTDAPHAGRLFYEWFAWRVDGVQWRRLARRAQQELGGSAAAC